MTDTGKTEALNLKSKVDRDQEQTVNLTGDVKLTNTGIIGIGKDNVEKVRHISSKERWMVAIIRLHWILGCI